MNLLALLEQDTISIRSYVPISRRVVSLALLSCVLHILALGFCATIMLSQPPAPVVTPLQVTLLQPAVPLPVRESGTPGPPAASTESVPASQEPASLEPLRKPPLHATTPAVVEAIRAPALPPPPPSPLPRERASLPVPPIATPPPEEPALSTGLLPTLVGADATSTLTRFGRQNPEAAGGTRQGRGKSGGRGTGEGSTLSARPDYGVNPKPPYPMLARRRGDQGVVLLRVHVRADGSVVTADIKQSSGSPLLDEAALQTVRTSWRFLPARLGDAPVESWVEVPIRFVLEEG